MKLVTVRSYQEAIPAHVARAVLDDAGIPSVVIDEHVVTVQWLYSTAIGGVKLKVAEQDFAQASALLDQRDEAAREVVPGARLPPSSGDICPECGGSSVRGSRLFRSTLAVSLWTNLPLYMWRQRWVCDSCGHTWKVEPQPQQQVAPETLVAEQAVQSPPESYRVLQTYLLVLAILLVGLVVQRCTSA